MRSFLEFVNTYGKKFVGLKFSDTTNQLLKNWCLLNGFDLTKKYSGADIKPSEYDFHTTVFFSTSTHDTKNGVFNTAPFELVPLGFKMLGANKNIPVLLIDIGASPELLKFRQYFEKMGYEDEWPEYLPHISLSYAPYSGDISTLEVPTFKIVANRYEVSNQ